MYAARNRIELSYLDTELMVADIHTKAFTAKEKWLHAIFLINVLRPQDHDSRIRFHHEKFVPLVPKPKINMPGGRTIQGNRFALDLPIVKAEEYDRTVADSNATYGSDSPIVPCAVARVVICADDDTDEEFSAHCADAMSQWRGRDWYQGGWQDDSSCLLYTSPSPRDLSTSRMPSSA